MKKLISFSLWGNNPKYCIGAIKNAELASVIYPDWICRFYCNKDVPQETIHSLISKPNTEVFILQKEANWKFATTRFLAMSDFSYDYVIFRDADSRLNLREKHAVDEWINSGKILHIMKDHPNHSGFPILAGMFGIKGKTVSNIDEVLNSHQDNEHYFYDQKFLQKYLYPQFINDVHINDEIFNNKPFPTPRNNYEFVGEIFNEKDQKMYKEHTASLINFLNTSFT